MASLLEELQEDLISDALSAPAAKRERNEWHEPVSWTFSGYVARCKSFRCPMCKRILEVGGGVYAEETATNGTRRLTRATQFPTRDIGRRMEIVVEELDGSCFDCLVSLGFDDLTDPPDLPTNIAGEGMLTTPRFRSSLGFSRKLGKDES